MPYLIVERKTLGQPAVRQAKTYILSLHELDRLYSKHIDAEMVREFKRCKQMIVNYLDFQMIYKIEDR